MIAIIDFGMGNLFSVKQACKYAGLEAIITSKKKDVSSADAVILPGVGAFGDAMLNLNKLGLIKPILDFIKTEKPFMGICLGMQLLFSESEEFGKHYGLNIIEGSVLKFSAEDNKEERAKVPYVGWNRIRKPLFRDEFFWGDTLLDGIKDDEFMYFVHSYYCLPRKPEVILSVSNYKNIEYCSSILWKNIFACQFHPEKSANEGLKIYKNLALRIKDARGNRDGENQRKEIRSEV